ncbi:MAG TPA: hypothetical protein VFC67_02520 [Prolixibacteraceae bacterium]|nr:hypothetical protein [Prolixibacteraceae bacterium]
MKRRNFLVKSTAALVATAIIPTHLRAAYAVFKRGLADVVPLFAIDPTKDIITAPKDPALWPAFREQLTQWRKDTRKGLSYNDALYRKPEFAWLLLPTHVTF